jgi:hypothetical protein
MSAVVGMTSNRAKLEADVRELKKKLSAFDDKSTALKIESPPEGTTRRTRRHTTVAVQPTAS